MAEINYNDFLRQRITQLRLARGLSEYQLSLDLGQNRTYIQNITNGRSLPSLPVLYNICEYFKITPHEFFDTGVENPIVFKDTVKQLIGMTDKDIKLLNALISRLKEKN